MFDWFYDSRTRNRVILYTVFGIILLWILIRGAAALVPFFLGSILIYVLMPIVDWLEAHAPRFWRGKRVARTLAVVLVYILLLGLVAGVLTVFVPLFREQGASFVEEIPGWIESVQRVITHDLPQWLEKVPPELSTAIETNVENLFNQIIDSASAGLEATAKTLFSTVGFVIGLVIVPFWGFYILNDQKRFTESFYELIPDKARADVRAVVQIVDRLLSSYVRGQIVLCLSIAIGSTIGLLILGIEPALLLGSVAGILDIIPYLGPYLGALLPLIIALASGDLLKVLWVGVVFFIVQQAENLLLLPKIQGNAVKFHPAVVMVIVVVGAEVSGIWGMLLGVPLAAILRDVFRYFNLRTTERGATPELAMEIMKARLS